MGGLHDNDVISAIYLKLKPGNSANYCFVPIVHFMGKDGIIHSNMNSVFEPYFMHVSAYASLSL
jgi:hypothetical protein